MHELLFKFLKGFFFYILFCIVYGRCCGCGKKGGAAERRYPKEHSEEFCKFAPQLLLLAEVQSNSLFLCFLYR